MYRSPFCHPAGETESIFPGFKLIPWLPIPYKLGCRHLDCSAGSCTVDLLHPPLQLISCPSALLCGFRPPWPSLSFLMPHILSHHAWRSSQLRSLRSRSVPDRNSARMALPRGVFCESSACLGSPHVALYSSVLILRDPPVAILLASLWAPGGQESCLPCSSLCPPRPCSASGMPPTLSTYMCSE